MITVGKVLSANSTLRQLTVDIGTRLVTVYVPLQNGDYFPKQNDMIEIGRDGRNVVYKRSLLRGEAVQPGDYIVSCDRYRVIKNGEEMFTIFGDGYCD